MKRKIVDEGEVRRWIEEGRTYRWMADEYLRKYKIDTTPATFSNFRYRKGLERRIGRDEDLIPWMVKQEHRWAYPLAMLRVEGRRRAGFPLRSVDASKLESWKAMLAQGDRVVHYEPDTEAGWFYVPRRQGVDLDLIRKPDVR